MITDTILRFHNLQQYQFSDCVNIWGKNSTTGIYYGMIDLKKNFTLAYIFSRMENNIVIAQNLYLRVITYDHNNWTCETLFSYDS